MAGGLYFRPPIFFLTLLLVTCTLVNATTQRKIHIVYMGGKLDDESQATSVHQSLLREVTSLDSKEAARELLIYSYKRSFNGFAAHLTDEEAKELAGKEGVVSVFTSGHQKLQTTRSWDFLGLTQSVKRAYSMESDTIIGVIDTGIWPESESFDDEGIGPPPKKWKGICQSSEKFHCNNKIIGARYYRHNRRTVSQVEELSPRDMVGHGTHTSSIAAGRDVDGASLYGIALGTARGGVPRARIAVYKVCWLEVFCEEADILAAFDDAIADGVDLINLSLAYEIPEREYFQTATSIGAFHAMKHGVLTCTPASNTGMHFRSVKNTAPWTLTVAASSTDRVVVAKLLLGNGTSLLGRAVNTFHASAEPLPLIHAYDASVNKSQAGIRSYCEKGNLNPHMVRGKIVLCDAIEDGGELLRAGAAGAIFFEDYNTDYATAFPLPATLFNQQLDYNLILDYIQKNKDANATIFKSVDLHDTKAPGLIVSFSARGPNPIDPKILKPDITAPGVEILAAVSPKMSVSEFPGDKRRVKYLLQSGTSMACPHAAAAAAYLKSFHPHWSPAAIKSALMTTALPLDSKKNFGAELAYGSGQINPTKALEPGLVYDAHEKDYVQLLCNRGYDNAKLRMVTGDNSSTCPPNTTAWDLNYPSIAVPLTGQEVPPWVPVNVTYHNVTIVRTVTNVGSPAGSTYRVNVVNPNARLIGVSVEPATLPFKSLYEKKEFVVKIRVPDKVVWKGVKSAWILWSDGFHRVRTPIAVFQEKLNGIPTL